MAIDRAEFARNCVDQSLLFGVNPHYLIAVAEALSGIKDNSDGNRIGPFRQTQQDWNANGSDAQFEITLLPQDINNPDMQCIFAALMTLRAQKQLLAELGRYPSVEELYPRWPNIPPPGGATIKAAMTAALTSTAPLVLPAIDAALEGMDIGGGEISLDSIDAAKRPIAQQIIDAFKAAGYGTIQQATGLANAIAESNLNPNAVNTNPPEHSVGLFQLNINGGVGSGHTEAELKDPAKNIELIIKRAKDAAPGFKTATGLHEAVTIFVEKVEQPGNQPGEIARRFAIAQKLLPEGTAPSVVGGGSSGAVVDKLKQQITAGKITFDSSDLKDQLLGLNSGTKVTPKLQALVLRLSELASPNIRISSLVREGSGSFHTQGRAVDIGNEQIAGALLPVVATDTQVGALQIDELIFDATVAGQADRNKWNYDQGAKHDFNSTTLDEHRNHIHFAVKA